VDVARTPGGEPMFRDGRNDLEICQRYVVEVAAA
jgi:hypothetical protein